MTAMTITLPKQLEARLFALYPDKVECESVIAKNLEKWLKLMEIMDAPRACQTDQIINNAKVKAERLRQTGITQEEVADLLTKKVKNLKR